MKRFENYAPVIIPTLCRYEHFRRCIDSLSRCTGAEYTDVYIGLDYPAKEEHWEGYRKICVYVKSVSGFHNLFVILREQNFGICRNIDDLKERVKRVSDRYIFSEDDNEFAPNFLEYMNEGLTRFKDNPNVLRICGCLMPWNANFNEAMGSWRNNAFPAMDYNAFGVGLWFDKSPVIPYAKDSVLNSWNLTLKALRSGCWGAINILYNLLDKESQIPDVCLRLYCTFNNKYCIFPVISKSKNWGHDGSGINSIDQPCLMEKQVLDISKEFYFDDFEIKDFPEVKDFVKQMYGVNTFGKKMVLIFSYTFYRITGLRIRDFRKRIRNKCHKK